MFFKSGHFGLSLFLVPRRSVVPDNFELFLICARIIINNMPCCLCVLLLCQKMMFMSDVG